MGLLAKLESIVVNVRREPAPVDPATFGDPLALRVLWTPSRAGGTSFRTHRLVATQQGRLEFRPNVPWLGIGIALLFAVMFVIGAGGPLGLIGPALIGLPIAALVFVVVRPVVFDRTTGRFWIGWSVPEERAGVAADDRSCRLADIHALQLVREYVRANRSGSFWSYELNVVLHDGRRINVVDHSDIDALRAEAAQVAAMLGCKVWDATVSDGGPVPSAASVAAEKNPVLAALGAAFGTFFVLLMLAVMGLTFLATTHPEKLQKLIMAVQPYVEKFLH